MLNEWRKNDIAWYCQLINRLPLGLNIGLKASIRSGVFDPELLIDMRC